MRKEYQRLTDRVEVTQTKIDKVADESEKAIRDVRSVIASVVLRFSQEMQAKQVVADIVKQSEPVTIKPTIIMHSGPNCGPCITWKSNSMPSWLKAGWAVEVIDETETKRGWPWFEITDGKGRTFEVDGALTNDKFLAAQTKDK